jgi:hypothetical protein
MSLHTPVLRVVDDTPRNPSSTGRHRSLFGFCRCSRHAKLCDGVEQIIGLDARCLFGGDGGFQRGAQPFIEVWKGRKNRIAGMDALASPRLVATVAIASEHSASNGAVCCGKQGCRVRANIDLTWQVRLRSQVNRCREMPVRA